MGAGLGDCVIALVEKVKAKSVIDIVNKEYYDKHWFEHVANVFTASCGLSVIY